MLHKDWIKSSAGYYEFVIGLEKLFNNRSPDKLRISILSFQVETLKSSKIRPLYVRVIKR